MKKIFYVFIGAVLLLGACQKETVTDLPDEMLFNVQYPVTKATGAAFESDDAMGVYVCGYDGETSLPLQISGNYANNAKSVYNGTTWTTTPTIYWSEGKFDVIAYYPYDKPASVDNYEFSLALDQSVPEEEGKLSAYEQSDLLWAKAEGVSQMESVPLTFSHKLSKVIINLVKGEDYEGDLPTDAIVRIHNTVPVAIMDLETGSVTKNSRETEKSITALQTSASSYSAIIVPQRLENKKPLVEVITKGVSYLLESRFVFKSGTCHTINIILSDNPDRVRIDIGGEIEGWDKE